MKSTLPVFIILLTGCKLNSTDKVQSNESVIDSTQIKLIVIKKDNQNPGFELRTDTIFTQTVDFTKEKVDVFFCNRNFQLPYYMPTESIYRDSVKDRECNWKIYPATVRCYEYDNKSRVVKMRIAGSGTTGSHTFIYDDTDRIIEMVDNSMNKYKMTYDKNGNLLEMTVDGGALQKKLDFQYGAK